MHRNVNKLWGEIPKEEADFVPDVSYNIQKAMSNSELVEYNCKLANNFQEVQYVKLEPCDNLVTHAINLHKYMNNLSEEIKMIKSRSVSDLPKIIPPIPEMPKIKRKHEQKFLNYIQKDFTPFSVGESVETPELSQAVVKKLLAKSVATLFAQIGFENSHQSVLDVLVDVLDAFFKKITFRLKLAEEDEERDSCGFPHTIERVLVELGFGGMKGLHDYYQARVVKYLSVLHKRCETVKKQYEILLRPKCPSPIVLRNNIPIVKIEEDDDVIEIDNPQLQISNNAVEELSLSSLKDCFQLLSYVEAETSSQNLAKGDENNM